MPVAHAEHPADIAQRSLGRHRAEGDDLADRIAPVALLHIIDHPVAIGLAEIDVEVGHRHPLGIQEPLEQQVVAQRIEAGDLQRISDQRSCARATPGPDRAAIALRPVDEIGNDQEIARKPHLQDGADLELQPLDIARSLPFTLVGLRVQHQQALLQPLPRCQPEIVGHRHRHAVLRTASESRATAACRAPGSGCSAWRSRAYWPVRSEYRRTAPPSAPDSSDTAPR